MENNKFNYNGNDITLKKENDNVYVNITEVAKSFPEKNLTQIMQSSEIQEYIKTLSELYNYSSADLVRVTRGGDVTKQGTWVHQKVALRVCQKLSTHFAIMVDAKIEELLTCGYTTLDRISRKDLARMILESEEEKERLQLKVSTQAKQIAASAPKVTFADAVAGSVSSCLIGELAKLITQNGYEIGEKRLFAWLREHGYLGTKGERYNIPNQQYISQGLFIVKKGVRSGSSGVLHTTITPKVTGKGQIYFINKFLK